MRYAVLVVFCAYVAALVSARKAPRDLSASPHSPLGRRSPLPRTPLPGGPGDRTHGPDLRAEWPVELELMQQTLETRQRLVPLVRTQRAELEDRIRELHGQRERVPRLPAEQLRSRSRSPPPAIRDAVPNRVPPIHDRTLHPPGRGDGERAAPAVVTAPRRPVPQAHVRPQHRPEPAPARDRTPPPSRDVPMDRPSPQDPEQRQRSPPAPGGGSPPPADPPSRPESGSGSASP